MPLVRERGSINCPGPSLADAAGGPRSKEAEGDISCRPSAPTADRLDASDSRCASGREDTSEGRGWASRPPPRGRAHDDFASKLVGSLREKGSVHTTLREYVSVACNRFTPRCEGVLAY
jgi:hypothetical protein